MLKVPELNQNQNEIFDNVITSLQNDVSLALEYAKSGCSTCGGKGYFQMDQILKNGLFTKVDGKESRVTAKDTHLCRCTKKKIIKAIKELSQDAVV